MASFIESHHCRFSAEDHALQYAEQTTVKCPSSFQFRTDFCRRAEHFHECMGELLHKFNFFLEIPTCELIADGYCLSDVLSCQ